MGQSFCKYHAEARARWSCPDCQINFCPRCVNKAENGAAPRCPVCGERLASLGAGNIIKPFWRRIPRFFIFPLQFPPLILMLALVTLNVLVSDMLFGFLAPLAFFIIFMKYAYEVLEDTAHGHLKAKPLTWDMLARKLELPFAQIFIVFINVVVNTAVYDYLGEGVFSLTVTTSVLMFPASIMVLAVEHSFFSALNPFGLVRTIRRIGPSYLILCVFLAMLVAGSWVLLELLMSIFPPSLYISLLMLVLMHFSLIMFNMMGYVLYQHHEALGYNIALEYDEAESNTDKDSATNAAGEIEILLREGKLEEAEKRMVRMIQKQPADFALRERLQRLHLSTFNKNGLEKHSADYVSRLLIERKPTEAIRVFIECYKIMPEFKIADAKQRHELAMLLTRSGHSRAALSLLNNLHKDYPSYEGIPAAYLLVARLMFEYFSQEDKARQILEYLSKKYPEHPMQEKIQSYLDMLNSIATH